MTEAAPAQGSTIIVHYPLTVAQIEASLAPLLAVEKPAEVVKALAMCRNLRGEVEDRRKLLKADSLDYGRRVDDAAKQLTAAIVKYEEPLKQRKAEHEEAKAKAKRDAEQAERERLLAAEREQMAKERAAAEEEAKVQAQRLRIEAQQLEQRREAMRREKEAAAAELRAERERMAEEQRIERDKMLAERAETERLLAKAEEQRRAAQATLDRIEREKEQERTRARMAAEAEEQRLEKERHDRELAAKVAAAQPDIVKLQAWAGRLEALRMGAPQCADTDARTLVREVQEGLERLAGHLFAFDGSPIEYSDAPVHQSFGGEVANVNE